MKKLIVLILSLCLLSGCAAPPANSDESQSEPRVPPSVAQTDGDGVTYMVETEVVADSIKTDDGTVLYEYRNELPRLTALSADGKPLEADTAVTSAFNGAFDLWRQEGDRAEMIEAARGDYAWRQGEDMGWTNYAEEFTFTAYETDRLVSVAGKSYSYTGGAHPNTGCAAWNFDLERGAFVPVDTLGQEGTAFIEAVAAEIIRQMEERAGDADIPIDNFYWSDYADIVALWTNYAVSFDETGMTVAFSPYDLAAFAVGGQEFQFTYDFLQPYLSDYGRELLSLQD